MNAIVARNLTRKYGEFTAVRDVSFEIHRGEGLLAKDGPLVVRTGKHTGRSAQDRFIVRDRVSETSVWWGKTNKPMGFVTLEDIQGNIVRGYGMPNARHFILGITNPAGAAIAFRRRYYSRCRAACCGCWSRSGCWSRFRS